MTTAAARPVRLSARTAARPAPLLSADAALEQSLRRHPAGRAKTLRASGFDDLSPVSWARGAGSTSARRTGAAAPAIAPRPPRAVTPRSATAFGPVRLTRRGRLALVLLVATVAFLAFSLGRATRSDATPDLPTSSRVEVVVEPGETLWGLARRIAPDTDPRETVARLRELNRLGTSTLQAGQTLQLPA